MRSSILVTHNIMVTLYFPVLEIEHLRSLTTELFSGMMGAIYMEVADGNFRQINLQGRNVFRGDS